MRLGFSPILEWIVNGSSIESLLNRVGTKQVAPPENTFFFIWNRVRCQYNTACLKNILITSINNGNTMSIL